MSNDEYPIAVSIPPTPEQVQFLWDKGGCQALARLIAAHVKQGLEKGTWTVVNNRPIPIAMLPFFEETSIMEETQEETCDQIVP